MANARLYPFWGSLTEGLKSGEPLVGPDAMVIGMK